MKTDHLNSWLEISAAAYIQNLSFFRKNLPSKTELSVVVKSNAYGHGMSQISELAFANGADSFCVHSIEEAISLRSQHSAADILILGYVPLELLELAVENNFRIAVFTLSALEKLSELTKTGNKQIRVHLKLETGTYRQGIEAEDIPHFLAVIRANKNIILEAAYTHFANIEDTTNHDFALEQLNLFNSMVDSIREDGFSEIKKHAACSAAILLFPNTHFDMVRLGISQYGLWPSRETLLSYQIRHKTTADQILKPVLSWKTRVGQIKKVSADQTIGYGRSFKLSRDSKIAVLPVGYADGLDRKLSNHAYVLINGRRAPIIGRICMNIFMVDVTDIPDLLPENEVVLLGRCQDEVISMESLAGYASTINYEFTARINPAIPRIVV